MSWSIHTIYYASINSRTHSLHKSRHSNNTMVVSTPVMKLSFILKPGGYRRTTDTFNHASYIYIFNLPMCNATIWLKFAAFCLMKIGFDIIQEQTSKIQGVCMNPEQHNANPAVTSGRERALSPVGWRVKSNIFIHRISQTDSGVFTV